MKQLQREDIHSLAKHSQLSGEQVEQALQQHVYQDKKSWADFLRISLLVLGIGFLTSGLVFFFAYNWADLPKFGKLAIVQGLLLLVSLLAIYPKFSTLTRKLCSAVPLSWWVYCLPYSAKSIKQVPMPMIFSWHGRSLLCL